MAQPPPRFWNILGPGPPAGSTSGPAQGLQQHVVLLHLLLVVLQLPPQLVQLFTGELPGGLRLEGQHLR